MMARHCFYCGRGLSRKHRSDDPETRLLRAIFNIAPACHDCGTRMEAKRGVPAPGKVVR